MPCSLCGMRTGLAHAVACLTLSGTLAAQSAFAQGPGDTTSDGSPPSSLTRVLKRFGEDSGRVRPLVGIVVPGSGPAAGVLVEDPSFGGSGLGAGIDGLWSLRNYQHVSFRVGRLAGRRALPHLRQADAAVTSMMDVGDREVGHSVYLEHRFRRLPRLNYFASDSAEIVRTDFGVSRTTTDLVFQWAATPRTGVGARAGVMTTHLFDGTDKRRPNTHERFGARLDDDTVATTRYATAAVGLVVDRRDDPARPTAGWMLQTAATGMMRAGTGGPSFVRASLDARHHRRLFSPRHVLASRLLASADLGAGSNDVPFYLQQTLGGANTMRAFPSYRLRGTELLHATVESRWRLTSMIEVAPFLDAGRVRGGQLPSGLSGWLVAPGVGLRLRYKQLEVGRLDVARGRDGVRAVYAFDAPF